MYPYTLIFGYRFVFGFSSEGEHKVRPYIGFGHWLDSGIFSRQHFPLEIGVRVKLKLWKIGRKKGTSMILCFYWQEPETFKENHKIIDVPLSSTKIYDRLLIQ